MKGTRFGFVIALLLVAIAVLSMTAFAQSTAPTAAKAAPNAPTQAKAPARTPTHAQGMQEKRMMGPSIIGTYKLVSRKLSDGKTLMPPDIEGLQTFTKTYRNFNVAWSNPDGKHFSYSVISEYKLTGNEYSETRLYSVVNDEIGVMSAAMGGMKPGAGPQYAMTSETKTSPVTEQGGKIEFQLPFDPPRVVIEGGKLTATLPDGSVDTWERVN